MSNKEEKEQKEQIEKIADSSEASLETDLQDVEIIVGENPYAHAEKKPEDIMRIFYTHNVPILPVMSKRGTLLGIIKKEDVIAELSDIARSENVKVDKFITNLAKKLTFEEVLTYCTLKEFPTINIFCELQSKLSRVQLMSMCEGVILSKERKIEAEETQSEEQIMEWMIYLILEHIPRPLYALNKHGKTVFYNSLFEESYKANLNKDVSIEYVEKTLKKGDKNEIISSKSASTIRFYNKDLKMYYEKVPMKSSGETVGYLIYFDSEISEHEDFVISGMDISGMTLAEILDVVERQVLIATLRKEPDLQKAAKSLLITKQILFTKIKKYKIDLKKIN